MNQVHKRERAKRDLEEIFVFLGERNLDTGLDFLFAAEQTLELLAQMPLIGSQRRFRSGVFHNLRQFPVKGYAEYLIFYSRPTLVSKSSVYYTANVTSSPSLTIKPKPIQPKLPPSVP